MTAIQTVEKRTARESGIELLKIAAIFLIVIHHVVQTLSSQNDFFPVNDYVLNIYSATTDVKTLFLAFLRFSGNLGNTIFFVCSAWFLLDSRRASKKKIFNMILDVWLVSVIILSVVYFMRGGNVSAELIIKSFLPTTFGNNWYITCYVIFYVMHPVLNGAIRSMNQKTLLTSCTFLSFLYILCNFVWGGVFFVSSIIIWVTLYFVTAYMKLYLKDIAGNVKLNIFAAVFGIAANMALIALMDILGLKFEFLADLVLYWNSGSNPFTILTAISLMNIARHGSFKNSFINSVSKLSFLIYIVHENILLSNYYRPYIWQYIYEHFGYEHVIFWVFASAAAIFAAAAVVSFLYEQTLQRLVKIAGEKLYTALKIVYGKYERIVFKLH